MEAPQQEISQSLFVPVLTHPDKKINIYIPRHLKEFNFLFHHLAQNVKLKITHKKNKKSKNNPCLNFTLPKNISLLKDNNNVIIFFDLKELMKKTGLFSSLNTCTVNFPKLTIKFHRKRLKQKHNDFIDTFFVFSFLSTLIKSQIDQ